MDVVLECMLGLGEGSYGDIVIEMLLVLIWLFIG